MLLTWKIFELAKAKTTTPMSLRVIPDRTEGPMRTRALLARSTLVSASPTAKARVVCEQNSTEIPMATIRLTRDRALRDTPHRYIRPPRLVIMRMTVTMMTSEDERSRPIITSVMRNTAATEMPNMRTVSSQMVRYCS